MTWIVKVWIGSATPQSEYTRMTFGHKKKTNEILNLSGRAGR